MSGHSNAHTFARPQAPTGGKGRHRDEDDDEEMGNLINKTATSRKSSSSRPPADERSQGADKKTSLFEVVKRLLSYAAEDRLLISFGLFFVLSSSAFDAAIPNFTGRALASIVDSAGGKVRQHEAAQALRAVAGCQTNV